MALELAEPKHFLRHSSAPRGRVCARPATEGVSPVPRGGLRSRRPEWGRNWGMKKNRRENKKGRKKKELVRHVPSTLVPPTGPLTALSQGVNDLDSRHAPPRFPRVARRTSHLCVRVFFLPPPPIPFAAPDLLPHGPRAGVAFFSNRWPLSRFF